MTFQQYVNLSPLDVIEVDLDNYYIGLIISHFIRGIELTHESIVRNIVGKEYNRFTKYIVCSTYNLKYDSTYEYKSIVLSSDNNTPRIDISSPIVREEKRIVGGNYILESIKLISVNNQKKEKLCLE